jgi:hypothetical protein
MYAQPGDADVLAKLNLSNAEYNDVAILNAREDFGLFRKQIRKDMIWGWWTQEVAWQLQRFYNQPLLKPAKAGRRLILLPTLLASCRAARLAVAGISRLSFFHSLLMAHLDPVNPTLPYGALG